MYFSPKLYEVQITDKAVICVLDSISYLAFYFGKYPYTMQPVKKLFLNIYINNGNVVRCTNQEIKAL